MMGRRMGWSRGLLRACTLLAVLWVIFALIGSYTDWPAEREYQTLSEYIGESVLFALLPPLTVIAFGYCVLWAGQDFLRDATKNNAGITRAPASQAGTVAASPDNAVNGGSAT